MYEDLESQIYESQEAFIIIVLDDDSGISLVIDLPFLYSLSSSLVKLPGFTGVAHGVIELCVELCVVFVNFNQFVNPTLIDEGMRGEVT